MIHLRVWIRSLSQRSILQQHVRTLTIKDTTNTYYHFAQREKVNSGSRTLKEPSGYVSTDDEAFDSEGPPPDPPNPFIAVSAMGIGGILFESDRYRICVLAFFAIGIAAVGVYGSFYMAAWAVANSSLFP